MASFWTASNVFFICLIGVRQRRWEVIPHQDCLHLIYHLNVAAWVSCNHGPPACPLFHWLAHYWRHDTINLHFTTRRSTHRGRKCVEGSNKSPTDGSTDFLVRLLFAPAEDVFLWFNACCLLSKKQQPPTGRWTTMWRPLATNHVCSETITWFMSETSVVKK